MQIGSELYLYHEKQDAALCGVHCLNSLLQGHYFTEVDLMMIARELDEMEKQAMLEMGADTKEFLTYMAEDSGNVADDGNYSIQVLAKALTIWGLSVVPLTSPEAVASRQNPLLEKAFICNLANHWLTVRKVGEDWYNLNSLLDQPQFLSNFYLSAFLDTLMARGYTIFCVRGELPRVIADPAMLSDRVWKKAPRKPSGQAVQSSNDFDAELQAALEQSELEAAIQMSQQNPQDVVENNKRKPTSEPIVIEDDDEELQAAIRLSHQLTNSVTSQEKDSPQSVSTNEIPAEPEKSDLTTELIIRLPNSTTEKRRFLKTDTLQIVYDFLKSKGFSEDKYNLLSTFPRKVYETKILSLEAEGLSPGATLILSPK